MWHFLSKISINNRFKQPWEGEGEGEDEDEDEKGGEEEEALTYFFIGKMVLQ